MLTSPSFHHARSRLVVVCRLVLPEGAGVDAQTNACRAATRADKGSLLKTNRGGAAVSSDCWGHMQDRSANN